MQCMFGTFYFQAGPWPAAVENGGWVALCGWLVGDRSQFAKAFFYLPKFYHQTHTKNLPFLGLSSHACYYRLITLTQSTTTGYLG